MRDGTACTTPAAAMNMELSLATRNLLLAATLVSGWLAGGNIDRAFVAMPAWQEVGAVAWAEFSRHADLGNGLILYPLEAIGGALLSAAAAIGLHLERRGSHPAVLTLDASVALAVAGLAFTLKAAPVMLGIRDAADATALQSAFEVFRYWGNIRGACQVLAFAAQLGVLALLLPGRHRA
jgi:hypothetical protein